MIQRLTAKDEGWPGGLAEMESVTAPDELYLIGKPLPDKNKTLAIVGTRRPTGAGLQAARSIAARLSEAGFAIVSGLALGIDAAAHTGCLEAGGHTVAVLGCGVDVLYPKKNRALKERIERRGSVVSEFPPGTPSKAAHFPQRNRIIAGLARGVVVIEGGLRSGALITARYAIDANRDVYALPGSIRNPMAEGPNELVRTGQAGLVTCADHIFEDVGGQLVWSESKPGEGAPPLDAMEADVLFAMDDSGNSVDRVARDAGIELGKVALSLARLEIRGMVRKRIGGYELTELGSRARAESVTSS